jgi:hypothetical protein
MDNAIRGAVIHIGLMVWAQEEQRQRDDHKYANTDQDANQETVLFHRDILFRTTYKRDETRITLDFDLLRLRTAGFPGRYAITKNGPKAGNSRANIPQNAYAQADILRRRRYETDIRKMTAKNKNRSRRKTSVFINFIVQAFGEGCKRGKNESVMLQFF